MIFLKCDQPSSNVLGSLYQNIEECFFTYPYQIIDTDFSVNQSCCLSYHYKYQNVRETFALCSTLNNMEKSAVFLVLFSLIKSKRCKMEIRSIMKLMQMRCFFQKNDMNNLANLLDVAG